jgi:hypothetical protein
MVVLTLYGLGYEVENMICHYKYPIHAAFHCLDPSFIMVSRVYCLLFHPLSCPTLCL